MKVAFKFPDVNFVGEVTHSLTISQLQSCLPFEAAVHVWSHEIYFEVPFGMSIEPSATDVVDKGAICFLTQGNSFSIPFGPTPVSVGSECNLVAQVNMIGTIEEDTKRLNKVKEGQIERLCFAL